MNDNDNSEAVGVVALPADLGVMRQLFLTLAQTLLAILGDPDQCRASHLNVARQFLRDNGIDSSRLTGPKDGAEALAKMISDLPDLPGDLEDNDTF